MQISTLSRSFVGGHVPFEVFPRTYSTLAQANPVQMQNTFTLQMLLLMINLYTVCTDKWKTRVKLYFYDFFFGSRSLNFRSREKFISVNKRKKNSDKGSNSKSLCIFENQKSPSYICSSFEINLIESILFLKLFYTINHMCILYTIGTRDFWFSYYKLICNIAFYCKLRFRILRFCS